MKGTQERGFILGSVEERVLALDDNAMNVQSMAASRFVGPFFGQVQEWEKSLSHISEVVDVSEQSQPLNLSVSLSHTHTHMHMYTLAHLHYVKLIVLKLVTMVAAV